MNIQSAIDRHGTTKAELARKMGASASYITQLVSGQSSPSMKMLDKLAELIGCKRWEFFIDEMDRGEVARLLGLQQPSAEPAAAPLSEAHPQIQDELPFNGGEPSATSQQAIICPHCHQALVFNIASYEQK